MKLRSEYARAMRLCMFHPNDHPLERGWVGRIDGDRVVHLAAQTLQSYFLGGGGAREHAEYPLEDVTFLAPVLHPPAVRVFESQRDFAFANPAAILSPGAEARTPENAEAVTALVRPAAVIGAEGLTGGFTILGELRAAGLDPPKDRDFALFLGPWVETESEHDPVEWDALLAHAAANTQLRAGDVVAAPSVRTAELAAGPFELAADGLGVLTGRLA
jgi:hypothetical protein